MPVAMANMFGSNDDLLGREPSVRQDPKPACGWWFARRYRPGRFVERHDDDRRAITADQPGLADKCWFALLHRDRIDDALPWMCFGPASRISHLDESIITGTRDIRLGSDPGSGATIAALPSSIAFVHVDVDDLRRSRPAGGPIRQYRCLLSTLGNQPGGHGFFSMLGIGARLTTPGDVLSR